MAVETDVPREMEGINRMKRFDDGMHIIGFAGLKLHPGTRVMDVDCDGKTIVSGTLRNGRTFRGRTDWYVQWDDGVDTVVLVPGLLKKIL